MASPTADFERIYRRHARDVYRFALSIVRNPLEAEDVTQTTFLNAYRALERGDRPERPRSWLLAIAHNAIRSRSRWALRRPREVPLEAAEHREAPAFDEQPAVADLLRALGELPVAQREALALRELHGQTYPEIAESLGISVSAVESLIARARRTLRARRDSLRGIALLRWLAARGDAGVAAKASVVAAAATAVAGGMAVETHVAGPAHVPAAAAVVVPLHRPAVAARRAPAAAAPRTTAPAVRRPKAATTQTPTTATATATTTAVTTTAPATAPAASPVVATTAVTEAATSVAAATPAPTVSTPVTVPPVTVPPVTGPPVTGAPITTPAITTPTVTLPPLP